MPFSHEPLYYDQETGEIFWEINKRNESRRVVTAGGGGGGGTPSYVLPPATLTQLGGIKGSASLSIAADGTASIPAATATQLGGVKSSSSLAIAADGTATVPAGYAATGTFLQAGTDAAPRTIQSRLRDEVFVEDFGAVGNGTTDDTAALVAASNYVRSINGTLRFGKRGPYLCKQQLFWARMTVIGNHTVIKFSDLASGVDCLQIGSSWRDNPMTIKRITIDANNTGRDGVFCSGGGVFGDNRGNDHMVIDQLCVQNAVRDGFVIHTSLDGCWFEDFRISDLSVFDCGRHGIVMHVDNVKAGFINQGTFVNPEVRDIAKTEAGYDVYAVNNARVYPAGKISELAWISGEFDATKPLHKPNSFYFEDMRPGTQHSIGCGSWTFIDCTWESTNGTITGYPPVMACSSNTKIDATIVFGGVIAQYGQAVEMKDIWEYSHTTIQAVDRHLSYYPIEAQLGNGTIYPEPYKHYFGPINALYGETKELLKLDKGFRPRNLIVGDMPLAAATEHTTCLSNVPSAPSATPVDGGMLYVEAGALKYKGSGGTVTTLAPA